MSNLTVVGLSIDSSLTFLEKLNSGFFPDVPDDSPPAMVKDDCGGSGGVSGNGRWADGGN